MCGAAAFLLVSPALGHDHILVQSRPAQTGIRICVLDPKKFPKNFVFLPFCTALPLACWTLLMN
jgi:hypothetical protein